eukprot:1388670-Amphidinium_carterae.1
MRGGKLSFRRPPSKRLLVSGCMACSKPLAACPSKAEDVELATTPDTGESVFLPLPGLKRSVYRAEFLAVVRALEECKPKGLLVIAKVWFTAFMLSKLDAGIPKVDTGILRAEPWLRFRL